jgi:hypothetical protein
VRRFRSRPSPLSQFPDRLVEHGPKFGLFRFMGGDPGAQFTVFPLKFVSLGRKDSDAFDDGRDPFVESLCR